MLQALFKVEPGGTHLIGPLLGTLLHNSQHPSPSGLPAGLNKIRVVIGLCNNALWGVGWVDHSEPAAIKMDAKGTS